jgi:hypothetical protein
MTAPLALYCKSYRTDLKRVQRLVRSIERFNADGIPSYVSVPADDVQLFRRELAGLKVDILDDESIIARNHQIDPQAIRALPGHISQQIIKSEFWRLNLADAYMCLDSDAFFIRPFRQSDYLLDSGTPYTVLDEGHEFLASALFEGKKHVVEAFLHDAGKVQALFGRRGRSYSFGPFPLLWHRDVWESLEKEYLRPNGMNFQDAIVRIPVESHWYGEALLRYRAIQLMPCQPLFKVYHYAWQLDRDRRAGVGDEQLSQLYSGVIYQSAWEREMDWPTEGGRLASRIGRRLRRKLGRI